MYKIGKVLLITAALLLLFSGVSLAQNNYEVLFSVDMAVQVAVGNFDVVGDTCVVRGNFNGWGGYQDELFKSPFDTIYSALIDTLTLTPITDTTWYKFVYVHDGNDVWESLPFDPSVNTDNRWFHATGNEQDLNGNGLLEIVLDTVYFSNISFADIFQDSTDIIFEVDVRPAHAYLAMFDSITFGGVSVTSIDCVYIASGATGTTPEMQWVWDLPSLSSPEAKDQKMNDDGINGDLTAGDSVWSLPVKFHPGASKIFTFKYGLNGIDNEAGFASNHSQAVAPLRWFNQLGDQDSAFYGGVWNYVTMTPLGIEDFIDLSSLPRYYDIFQNYPNPFNPTTTIPYALIKGADVKLTVYNILGEEVRTLINRKIEPGVRTIVWDGRDDSGQLVGSGIYFYHFQAEGFAKTMKMVLMR